MQNVPTRELSKKALAGDVGAMKQLAKFYSDKAGHGIEDHVGDSISMEDFLKAQEAEKNVNPNMDVKAYEYYLMAAKAGDVESMTEVARRLYDAIGVERNEDESFAWYLKAAEAGDLKAMHVVAFKSDNPETKFYWHKKCAEAGVRDSICEVAIMYATGEGTPTDEALAEEWLAKLDEDELMSTLYTIALKTDSVKWMERAAADSVPAMMRMAEHYVEKNDFEGALIWYEKAGKKDYPDALSIVGDIYYIGEGNVAQDYQKAAEYYDRAAQIGFNMAAVKLALMYYHGHGVEKNFKKAFAIFKETAKTPEQFFGVYRFNSVAKFYVAKMYENGEGVRKNPYKALKWYNRAAGFERASRNESPHEIAAAMYKIATNYFMQKDFGRAVAVYKFLAEKSSFYFPYNLEAAKKLIWIYELGEGVPQDKAQAEIWRKKINVEDVDKD